MRLQMSSLHLVRTAFKISSQTPNNHQQYSLIIWHFNILITSPTFIIVLYECIEIMDNFHLPL